MEFSQSEHLILYDDECKFCSFWVWWILDKDQKGIFKFTGIKSSYGNVLLAGLETPSIPDSIIYVRNGEVMFKSRAVLNVVVLLNTSLSGICRFFLFLKLFWFYDIIYGIIAWSRKRIFGVKKSCRIPTQDQIKRFVF